MTCVRAKLVAYVQRELAPLELQLVEMHLARCKSCRVVRDEIEAGLSAARRELPVDPEALVALMRTGVPGWSSDVPDVTPAADRRPRRVVVVATSAAFASLASVAAAFAIVVHTPEAPTPAARMLASTRVATTNATPIGTTTTNVHALPLEPLPAAKPIAREPIAHVARVTMSNAKDAVNEARVDDDRAPMRTPIAIVDTKANAITGELEGGTLEELLPLLDECERLGRAGDADEARARYRALEVNPRFAAHADLVAYNRARLEGLVLGDVDASLVELTRLARESHGHVAAEAALTRCEVERKQDACAALACLDNIADHGDADTALDAHRLRDRWRSSCDSP